MSLFRSHWSVKVGEKKSSKWGYMGIPSKNIDKISPPVTRSFKGSDLGQIREKLSPPVTRSQTRRPVFNNEKPSTISIDKHRKSDTESDDDIVNSVISTTSSNEEFQPDQVDDDKNSTSSEQHKIKLESSSSIHEFSEYDWQLYWKNFPDTSFSVENDYKVETDSTASSEFCNSGSSFESSESQENCETEPEPLVTQLDGNIFRNKILILNKSSPINVSS